MLAVLDESMRVFPPVPGGLPRYTAKGGGVIAGEFIPESVCLSLSRHFYTDSLSISGKRNLTVILGPC